MNYQHSLRVAKRKQSPTFTDGDLPTFTEGREIRNIIAPPFTESELPTFTEGSKKITSFPKNYGVSPRKGLNFFFNQGILPGKGSI